MSAKLEQLEGLKHQLAVMVSAEEVTKAFQKRLNEFAAQAKLKGFRPGKVPVRVVEQKFGQGLLQEVAAKLIEKSFDKAIVEQSIKVAGLPDIDFDHATLKKDEPLNYVAKFEVYPNVSLSNLEGVEIESVKAEVGDDDVSGMLIKLRTQHADWEEVSDRPAKLGDRLTIDFDGVIDGEPLENGSAKGASLELGSKSMIPGFEDGLIGAKSGETKELNISFPEEYHVEELRAKPVTFSVVVHKIESPKLPALDDDFAKKMGAEEGVDSLKKKIEESMQAELDNMLKAKLKETVLDKLFELNPIDVPSALIDNEIKNLQEMTRQQIRNMQQQSGNNRLSDKDIQDIPLGRDPYVEEATKRVVLGLLLAEVIKANEIKAEQEAVLNKVREIAAAYPNADEVYNFYAKNNRMLAEIEALVLEEAAVQALLDKAAIKEVQKSYDAVVQGNNAEN